MLFALYTIVHRCYSAASVYFLQYSRFRISFSTEYQYGQYAQPGLILIFIAVYMMILSDFKIERNGQFCDVVFLIKFGQSN